MYPAKLRKEAKELSKKGLSNKDIAGQLGVGASTVCGWLRQNGKPTSKAKESKPRGHLTVIEDIMSSNLSDNTKLYLLKALV